MKKQLFLLLFITSSTFGIAQYSTTFGIRGGLSVAGMHGDAVNNLENVIDFTNGMITTGNRTGFFAGSYATVPLSEMVALEPALYYSQKGYAISGSVSMKSIDFLGANAKAQLNAHYIDLPVLLKANIGGLQIFAGPQVSYLAKANLHTSAGLLGINLLNKNLDVSDQFNRWDAGITGGVGYQFTNGLNLSAAYDHGLMRMDADKNLNTYNRSFKIGIGLRL
jgi:hypothetical protein